MKRPPMQGKMRKELNLQTYLQKLQDQSTVPKKAKTNLDALVK